MSAVATPGTKLRRLARSGAAKEEREAIDPLERCELCGQPVSPEHRHLVDMHSRQLLCACRACVILFDRREAGGGHYRLVPERRLLIEDFALDDARWAALRVPVDMAFFFHSTPAGRAVAFYPSPMGATESLLELDDWETIVAANPVLETMQPDVEALLVNRAQGARGYWLVPIDDAYALVGVLRSRWKGLSGGQEVWQEIERFFDGLARKAKTVTRDEAKEEAKWPRT